MALKLSYYDKTKDVPDGCKWYTCCICGHTGIWDRHWAWYGSLKDDEDGDVDKVCSGDCMAAYNTKHRIPQSKRHVND